MTNRPESVRTSSDLVDVDLTTAANTELRTRFGHIDRCILQLGNVALIRPGLVLTQANSRSYAA